MNAADHLRKQGAAAQAASAVLARTPTDTRNHAPGEHRTRPGDRAGTSPVS